MKPVAIYKITNALNGKMYIGQTVNPIRRFAEHASRDYEKHKSRSRIGRAIKKYGKENFEFQILCWCPDKTYADAVEIKLINAYDTRGIGYNICAGGKGTGSGEDHPKFGVKDSKETRRKKTIARLGEKNPNYGRKFSAEVRARMGASKKGRVITREWRAKIGAANKGKRNVSAEQMSAAIKAAVEKTSCPITASRGVDWLLFPSIKETARNFGVADVTIHRWLKKGAVNKDGWSFVKVNKNGY